MVRDDYRFYSRLYRGGLSEAAFGSVLPDAARHVSWLAGGRCPARCEWDEYKRAVCAACDVFAQYGQGQIASFQIGEVRMNSDAGHGATTGTELATAAAIEELAGMSLLFAGAR